jgi:hypothetical protein
MQKLVAPLVGVLLALVAIPTAHAAPCEPEPVGQEALAIDVPAAAGTDTAFYVAASGVWQESNGHAGLQEQAGVCFQKNNGQLIPYAPDTDLLAA